MISRMTVAAIGLAMVAYAEVRGHAYCGSASALLPAYTAYFVAAV